MNGQEPSFIISCNLAGGESYLLANNTDSYFTRLENAFNDIKSGKGGICVTLSSATLEYSLNFMLSVYCFNKYHFPDYEPYLESYRNIRFKNKLTIVPSIISDGVLSLRKEKTSIQCLYELISYRNNLLHNSSSVKVQKFDFPQTGAVVKDDSLFIPRSALKEDLSIEFPIQIEDNYIDMLTAEKCVEFGSALFQFREYIISPYLSKGELEENELIERQRIIG